LWVGGQEILAPARWYFCPPGAKHFPYAHGNEASPWWKPGEDNGGWGEVWPRGRWDRGLNPGYTGRCFVGERDWFLHGHLPACCFQPPIRGEGGLLLGGSAVVAAHIGPHGTGGLVLGGSAAAYAFFPAIGTGGLILGGSGVPHEKLPAVGTGGLILGGSGVGHERLPAVGTGGLILGGSGVPHEKLPAIGTGGLVLGGSGSGTEIVPSGSGSGSGSSGPGPCSFCSGGAAAAEFTFTPVGITNGSCSNCANLDQLTTLRYFAACEWVATTPTVCTGAQFWTLTYDGTTIRLVHTALVSVYTLAVAAWDCKSTRTLNNSGGGNTLCKTPPSTIKITPV